MREGLSEEKRRRRVEAMLAVCHTYYSLQAGVRSPAEWARAAAARGYRVLAAADVDGLYGAVEFYRAAEAEGLRPVIGSTLPLPGGESLTVLVLSDCGYRQLCRLLTRRNLEERFCLWDYLRAETVDGLLFLARTPAVLGRLAEVVPEGNVYRLPAPDKPARSLWDQPDLGEQIPTLPVPDAWFLEEEDRETFEWLGQLRARSGGACLEKPDWPGAVLPEAVAWQENHPDGAALVERLLARCRFRFEFGYPVFPRLELPTGVTAEAQLRRLCEEALARCYGQSRLGAARDRLEHELRVICANGFADYFLYVHAIVGFAKSRRIPVEVRGSAASSIVTYLLGFTHCCPLEHDLYFERFLNPGRPDLPDIDVDIADNRRDEVIEFCYGRWGQDHVAMIATVQRYRIRRARRDAGRVLDLPAAAVQRYLDGGGPLARQDQLERIAAKLVGLPRHLGVHCGGLVITPGPLNDITPLTRAAKGVVITHFEKDQAEALGLIKMDLLGNSALSVISEGRELLARRGLELPEPGPVYDYKVNRLFAAGDTLGVYQCESPGMRQMCRALKPTNRKEAAAALALIRPGPAASGMKDVFIRRCRGLEKVSYLHSRMAEFLAGTYGVMLYQEDVMKVAVQLAGYSPGEADLLRRLVKDRTDPAFARERRRFVAEKAASAGVPSRIAETIWEQVGQFASYSFCKAHAAVYGRLAWLTARLKAHYPREFYTAVLNAHKSMYPRRVFVWDAMRHGIPVLPVDVCESDLGWTAQVRGIRAGLGLVKGLRQCVARQILAQRGQAAFGSFEDFRRRIGFQGAELENLVLLGACRAWGSREELLEVLGGGGIGAGQPSLFPGPPPRPPDLLETELLLTGIPFCRHPVDRWEADACPAAQMGHRVNRSVCMVGILDACKFTYTGGEGEKRRLMSFVTLEDASGLFEVVLFPDQHERYGHLFSGSGPYWVRGRVTEKWDSLVIEAQEVRVAGLRDLWGRGCNVGW